MKRDKTNITIKAYENNAVKYEKNFMDFTSYKEKIELFQKKYIKKGNTLFDIGCGPGNNGSILLKNDTTLKISGIDLSNEMVKLAEKNVPQGSFQVMDIREIDEKKSFDTIIASFCIVHLSDSETTVLIKKISNMLNPNGTLYISFMEGKNGGYEKTSFSKDDIFFNYYNRETINTLLLKNNISPLEILEEGYEEEDGTITKDIFIFAKKVVP